MIEDEVMANWFGNRLDRMPFRKAPIPREEKKSPRSKIYDKNSVPVGSFLSHDPSIMASTCTWLITETVRKEINESITSIRDAIVHCQSSSIGICNRGLGDRNKCSSWGKLRKSCSLVIPILRMHCNTIVGITSEVISTIHHRDRTVATTYHRPVRYLLPNWVPFH